MKRFEIMEKLYLSKAWLKMAGGGDDSSTSPFPGSATVHGVAHWNKKFVFECKDLQVETRKGCFNSHLFISRTAVP